MLNVSSGLYVVSLIAFMLSVVMLGVVAPSEEYPTPCTTCRGLRYSSTTLNISIVQYRVHNYTVILNVVKRHHNLSEA